jgi:lysozyme
MKLLKSLLLFGLIIISIGDVDKAFGVSISQEPDRQKYPVRGIDVSAFQKKIDWSKINPQEMNFVVIKATEGGDFKDKNFAENWRKTNQAKLTRGAYHFFTFCKPGKVQAKNFIDTVPTENNVLPPIIDLEFKGNCKARPSKAALKKELQDYIAAVQKNYRQTPVLYVTHEFYDAYLQHEFVQNPIWISNLSAQPYLVDGRRWTFWQYTNQGKVAGVETPVDLNVFNGSIEQFQELLGKI